jgi:hypothetical protein
MALPGLDPLGMSVLSAPPGTRWRRSLQAGEAPLWIGLALLAALRFVGLEGHGLWIDEALTLSDALHQEQFKNPLGYRLCALLYGLLPARPDEAWMRLPSALAGALSLFLCAFAFRPWAGPRGALVAALFLGVSSWHLYWSHSARFYTLAQCAVLLGTGLLLRARGGPAHPRGPSAVFLWSAAGLSVCALGLGFHFTALLVLPGLFLAGQLLNDPHGRAALPPARRLLWALALLVGAAGAPWAFERVASWRLVKGGGNPLHLVLTSGFYFGPLLLSAALVGVGHWWRRRSPAAALALWVCVSALLLALALSLWTRMTAQYVFVLLPFVCLLAAAPWCRPAPGRGSGRPGTLALGVLTLVLLPNLVQAGLFLTHRNGERPHWREAYTLVARQRLPSDLLMGMAAPVGEYYLDPLATYLREPRQLVYLDRFRSRVPERWDRTGRRTWFVVNFEELEDWDQSDAAEFRRTLSEDCRLVASWPLEVESRDLSVHVFLRDG